MKPPVFKLATILSIFATIVIQSPSRAFNKTYTATGGSVNFVVIGNPTFLKIKGDGAPPTGSATLKDSKLSAVFSLDLNSLKTGNDTRNDHMKNIYLEVQKYPKATLTITDFVVEVPSVEDQYTSTPRKFEGNLELHGKVSKVTGEWTPKKTDAGHEVSAKFNVKFSDYGMNIPSFADITMADNVDIDVKTVLK